MPSTLGETHENMRPPPGKAGKKDTNTSHTDCKPLKHEFIQQGSPSRQAAFLPTLANTGSPMHPSRPEQMAAPADFLPTYCRLPLPDVNEGNFNGPQQARPPLRAALGGLRCSICRCGPCACDYFTMVQTFDPTSAWLRMTLRLWDRFNHTCKAVALLLDHLPRAG